MPRPAQLHGAFDSRSAGTVEMQPGKFSRRLFGSLVLMSPALLSQSREGRPIPPEQMKTLGLVGGTSWHSTVEYYRYINQAINNLYGDNTNPPLVIYNVNQQRINALQEQNRWDEIAGILSGAGLKLRSAGAQALLLCSNTAHKVYGPVCRHTALPVLHIADATGLAIQKAGLNNVGLVGTLYTMEGDFIAQWLKQQYGINCIVPGSAAVRQELQRIIIQELAMGIFKPESKRYVLAQIESLRKQGAQGIVLGCTEFPLIITQADLPYPVFDTTYLHALMGVDFILGRYLPPEQHAG
jgi:aspartate racemase